jgi:hypothetical protein
MLKASPMSADPALVVAVLACSRCDGPVQPEDLTEGIAVRVDGQPVCALCVESLPPALRLQIIRARALKGLAITTYRMAVARHPEHQFYTFTNAGLLLLHRRALVHGTEFPTPDLPAAGAPPPPTPRQQRTKPTSNAAMWAVVGGAAVLVAGGIALLALPGTPTTSRTHPATEVPAASPGLVSPTSVRPGATAVTPAPAVSAPVVPAVVAPAATVVTVPPTPETAPTVAPVTVRNRTANEYLHDDITAYEALLAAERDGANGDTITWLVGRTHADREQQLRMANKALAGSHFDATLTWLDKMPLPANRPEFADLATWENDLRTSLEQRRRQEAATPPAAVPANPDGAAPAVSPPAPVAVQPPPAVAPAPTQPTLPAGPTAANAKPQAVLWTGLFTNPKLKPTSLTEDVRFPPSPWPTLAVTDEQRFTESEKIPEKSDRGIQQLTFQVPAAQVTNGGLTLLLHRGSNALRKALLVSLQDAPAIRVTLDGDDWTFKSLPVTNPGAGLVTVHIEDEQPMNLSFWLGPVALVRNADPDAAAVGLLPPALMADNIATAKDLQNQYVKHLRHLAKMRGAPKEAGNPQWFSDVKLLVASPDKDLKLTLFPLIKQRLTHAKDVTPYCMEELPLAHLLAKPDELYSKIKIAPTTSQTLLVLVPNGAESGLSPEEWLRSAQAIAAAALGSEAAKPPRKSCIPVLVLGSLDGAHPVNRDAWKRIASNLPFPLIDIERADAPTQADRLRLLVDGLATLAYQYRYVQRTRL